MIGMYRSSGDWFGGVEIWRRMGMDQVVGEK